MATVATSTTDTCVAVSPGTQVRTATCVTVCLGTQVRIATCVTVWLGSGYTGEDCYMCHCLGWVYM